VSDKPQEVSLRLPASLEQSLPFRRLRALPEGQSLDAAAALFLVWRIFGFLRQCVQPGLVGWLTTRDRTFVEGDLKTPGAFDLLVEAGFLVAVEGGWRCPLFEEHNAHLDPARVTKESKGGNAAKFHRVLDRSDKAGPAQLAFVPADHFVRADASVLTPDELNDARNVVNALDGMLDRHRGTGAADWPRELILAADAVARAHGYDAVRDVCLAIASCGQGQNHLVPTNAEQCCQRFADLQKFAARLK
jgi:hypothetical protein